MDLLAHCEHRLTVLPDSDESAAGLFCVTCGEYVFELDDVEIVDALSQPEGAVEERDRYKAALDFIVEQGNWSLVRNALLKAKLDRATSSGGQ